MWSPQAQIITRNSFLPIPNATPELSATRYARIRSTTCICAHSSSIHQLHPNSKSRLYIYSNSLKWMLKSEFSGREHGFRCYSVVQDSEYVDDGFYIRRCVEVARQAIGHTSPNPMVGCIIVKNGEIVGEGFHPKAGQPHAEVFALRDAGDLAENATAYVSLEPCNHYGRTPPCTEALIKAKVKKVVVGMVDPNPIVASKGVNRLREAGIDVTVSIEEDICKKLNEAYIHQMLTGKPFLTLRYSLSVNGCFLDQIGEEVEAPGGYYSKLLQEYDAVIFSPSSSSKELTIPVSKEKGAKQPLWIILASPDSLINIPPITDSTTKVIIFTNKEAVIEPQRAHTGIETVVLDRLNISDILDYCKSQGFCSVLWDLRASFGSLEKLLNEGIEQKLLQKVVVEVLPQWEENQTGDSQTVIKSVAGSLKLKNLQPRISGQSVILEGSLSCISD